MQNNDEDRLVEHLSRREVVLFVGAGASIEAQPKLPTWKELIKELRKDLPELAGVDISGYDDLDVAQWFVDAHGRERLQERIVELFGNEYRRPSSLQQALAKLPVNVVFTTNYDQLLERAFGRSGEMPDAVVDDSHVGRINDLSGTTVVKLHGCVSLSDTVVLTRNDYEQYADHHRALVTYLQSQLATRTFLFFGFSFADPNFRVIHQAIQRTLGEHHRQAYALQYPEGEPLFRKQWEKRGIRFLEFGESGEIVAFVERMAHGANRSFVHGSSLPHLLDALGRSGSFLLPAALHIRERLDEVQVHAHNLFKQASHITELRLDPTLPDTVMPDDEPADQLEKLRALFGLANGLEQMGFPLHADEWVMLGNAFYQHREWPLAVRAYTSAQRQYNRSDSEGQRLPDSRERRLLEGNLARAYLAQGQYARGEALLRRLVFNRRTRPLELNVGWLAQRPADLGELGYAVNRRVEQLRKDRHLQRGLEVLKGIRPSLKAGLREDWIDNPGPVMERQAAHPRERSGSNRPYLLNHLGKNYRLAYEINVDLREWAEANRCRLRPIKLFQEASQIAHTLPYPWSHRIDIYKQNLLRRRTAEERLRQIVQELDRLALDDSRMRRTRDAIKARYEDVWKRFGS